MRVIGFIEGQAVIEKILKHLGLWLVNARGPPRRPASKVCEDEGIEQPAPDDFFPVEKGAVRPFFADIMPNFWQVVSRR